MTSLLFRLPTDEKSRNQLFFAGIFLVLFMLTMSGAIAQTRTDLVAVGGADWASIPSLRSESSACLQASLVVLRQLCSANLESPFSVRGNQSLDFLDQ